MNSDKFKLQFVTFCDTIIVYTFLTDPIDNTACSELKHQMPSLNITLTVNCVLYTVLELGLMHDRPNYSVTH
jgi:hypothetical protein